MGAAGALTVTQRSTRWPAAAATSSEGDDIQVLYSNSKVGCQPRDQPSGSLHNPVVRSRQQTLAGPSSFCWPPPGHIRQVGDGGSRVGSREDHHEELQWRHHLHIMKSIEDPLDYQAIRRLWEYRHKKFRSHSNGAEVEAAISTVTSGAGDCVEAPADLLHEHLQIEGPAFRQSVVMLSKRKNEPDGEQLQQQLEREQLPPRMGAPLQHLKGGQLPQLKMKHVMQSTVEQVPRKGEEQLPQMEEEQLSLLEEVEEEKLAQLEDDQLPHQKEEETPQLEEAQLPQLNEEQVPQLEREQLKDQSGEHFVDQRPDQAAKQDGQTGMEDTKDCQADIEDVRVCQESLQKTRVCPECLEVGRVCQADLKESKLGHVCAEGTRIRQAHLVDTTVCQVDVKENSVIQLDFAEASRGLYFGPKTIFIHLPPSENDIFPPSRDTSFFDSHRGLFALILPYFEFILPFYFPFSNFLFPFLPFSATFSAFFS